jgi:hypothetical protein
MEAGATTSGERLTHPEENVEVAAGPHDDRREFEKTESVFEQR